MSSRTSTTKGYSVSQLYQPVPSVFDRFLLVVLYALSAVYFAGVMVRLMLTLTPVVCILSGVAFSGLLELFLKEDDSSASGKGDDSEEESEPQPSTPNKRMYDKVSDVLFIFTKLLH